jgi:DNA-directed RNA polymerase I subunit RPA43
VRDFFELNERYRHIPAFGGVVLGHSNLFFFQKTATIKAECPFAVCDVGFDATVWSPQIGMKLGESLYIHFSFVPEDVSTSLLTFNFTSTVGQVNLCSPDHIALLVHRTFNVSIPRHHIPTDHWEFEYGAAENDPEFGPGGQSEDRGREGSDGVVAAKDGEGGGKWVHSITGEKLGGPDGFLEFTVIG